jgi:large subunit ribosomal protein L25
MEKVYLDCLLREETGKSKVNSLRRSGFVPAIIYGQGKNPLVIKLDRSQLVKFMHAHHGAENMIITLVVSDGEKSKKSGQEKPVLIKEIQFDPVKDGIWHIDFNEISLTKAIEVKVPIEAKGDAIGVKQDGGVLTHVLWELEIECLPTVIPEKIEVDVTNMKIGDAVYVKDLPVKDGVKVLTDKEATVFTLMSPKIEEVVAEVTEGAAPAEPEVIKEKKEKAEEGEEEKAQEKPAKAQEKAPSDKK